MARATVGRRTLRLRSPSTCQHAACDRPRRRTCPLAPLDDLVALLDLEAIEVNIFRGVSPDENRQRVFGGQVAGQALVAAARTVDDPGQVHSLHAYFLRPGDPTVPILYEVDRIRDGKSFTTRRVVAIQHGKAIFNLQASFHTAEPGLDHQEPMEDGLPDPETCPTPHPDGAAQGALGEWYDRPRPIDTRYVDTMPVGAAAPAARSSRSGCGPTAAPRRSGAARLCADLRLGHDAARHHAAAPRALGLDGRSCRWPASTTPCGSTGRSGPTSGSSTTSGRPRRPTGGAWPWATIFTQEGIWWCRSCRRA